MEGAGKLIEDEDLREAMAERGLGTPATRAATIEGLISHKYIARDGRELHVTASGMRLIELVNEMQIEGLYSPKLTGDWEYKLRQMEQGQLQRDAFMDEIISYTQEIVTKAHERAEELKNQVFPDLDVTCPMCGAKGLKQTDATYECREEECKFKAKKHIAGRLLTEDEARELFTNKSIDTLTGFKSRFNKPFEAGLKLDEKFKIAFVFENDDDEDVELGEEQLVGEQTLTDGRKVKLYETEKAYHVPELVTKKDPKGVRIGKTILQHEIEREQAIKLISKGKTDLIKGFISNRTKRPFDAFLTFEPESGKVGFEIPATTRQERCKEGCQKSRQESCKRVLKRLSGKNSRSGNSGAGSNCGGHGGRNDSDCRDASCHHWLGRNQ